MIYYIDLRFLYQFYAHRHTPIKISEEWKELGYKTLARTIVDILDFTDYIKERDKYHKIVFVYSKDTVVESRNKTYEHYNIRIRMKEDKGFLIGFGDNSYSTVCIRDFANILPCMGFYSVIMSYGEYADYMAKVADLKQAVCITDELIVHTLAKRLTNNPFIYTSKRKYSPCKDEMYYGMYRHFIALKGDKKHSVLGISRKDKLIRRVLYRNRGLADLSLPTAKRIPHWWDMKIYKRNMALLEPVSPDYEEQAPQKDLQRLTDFCYAYNLDTFAFNYFNIIPRTNGY